jgi:TIR domain
MREESSAAPVRQGRTDGGMAHDVFISYSSKDKPTADAVCATLEANAIRCWIAPRDVLPGMEWGAAIVDAIHHSQVMVMVFSSRANDSKHIKREVERAVNRGVVIIPFRIEEVVPSASLEYFIGNVHWLDALTTPLEQHLQALADKVRLLLLQIRKGPEPRPDVAPNVRDEVTELLDHVGKPKGAERHVDGRILGLMGGGTLDAGAADRVADPPPAVARFCTQCGAANTRALKFCTGCGHSLATDLTVCGRCGARNSVGMTSCTRCGNTLAK